MRRDLISEFFSLFGTQPAVVTRAPGRVNLIGEHVDYNDGLVLPVAIDRYCYVAAAERTDSLLRIHSVQIDETVEVGFDLARKAETHWSDYVAGVAWSLKRARKTINGADIVLDSEVPLGAGLGSSAAVEVATALALLELIGETLDPIDLALVCQRAENEYVGARVGVMDQLSACASSAGSALLIDCRSLSLESVPVDESEVIVVIANTMVRHELAAGEYNVRREECEKAVSLLQRTHPRTRSLRDMPWDEIAPAVHDWPEHLLRRVRHVTTEIARVQLAVEALRTRDYARMGQLMDESQASLASDYEVSCWELDVMARLAKELGAHGARMTGGGFGGCVICLVDAGRAAGLTRELAAAYERKLSILPQVFVARSADGGSRVR